MPHPDYCGTADLAKSYYESAKLEPFQLAVGDRRTLAAAKIQRLQLSWVHEAAREWNSFAEQHPVIHRPTGQNEFVDSTVKNRMVLTEEYHRVLIALLQGDTVLSQLVGDPRPGERSSAEATPTPLP